MDYKELIEQLRNPSNDFGWCWHYARKAATAIETLLAEREAGGWISVEDRLPEKYHTVLSFSSADGINLAFCREDGRWTVMTNYPETPTHWMQLPKPPDHEQNEEKTQYGK